MAFISMIYGRLKQTFAKAVSDNPVVIRDLRTRMRGSKAFSIITAYVVFLCAPLLIMSAYMSYNGQTTSTSGGIDLFRTLMLVQTLLITFIVPALGSGAISLELENRTIEMLALTKLSSARIILGKQLSVFFFISILIVCSLPLSSICLMFGGISPAEVAVAYLLILVWAFLISSIAVFWSSLFHKTATAVLMSYAACAGYSLLTSIISEGIQNLGRYSSTHFVSALSGLYPTYGMYVALSHAEVCGLSLFTAGVTTVLHLSLAAVLLLTAMMHVKYRKVDRSLPIRILMIFIPSVLIWLVVGGKDFISAYGVGQVGRVSPQNVILDISLMLVVTMLGISASIFATGPIMNKQTTFVRRHAFSLRKAFTGNLSGALMFMVLWGAILWGALELTIWWSAAVAGTKISVQFWVRSCKFVAASLSVLAGISAVGILASSIFKVRRNAVAVVILYLLVMFAGISALPAMEPGNPFRLLGMFSPFLPTYTNMDFVQLDLNFGVPKEAYWLFTCVMYLIFALVALLLASMCAKKYGGVEEE